MLIFAVTGMGGVGKTALAVEAAHRALARGWFPGGTLFVDLRGYDETPVTADQAVLALLDALGVRDGELPPTTDRQYDAYRALLVERRDRMLLILDNASDPAQYLPLLPGTDHHRVLITSRDRHDALPVRLIDLETLAPDDAVALVTRALHDTDERDERPAREPDSLSELAGLCGHLPLALQIAVGMLRRRRHRDIASLVAEIRKSGDATAVLDHGSPGTDVYGRSLVLRPVLETSYRRLPPEHARLLRLLCLAPSAETGTEAISALAGPDTGSVLSLLEDLAARYLVTPVSNGNGAASAVRWRVHDLVRVFGTSVVERGEGETARERVLALYVRCAEEANHRLRWLPGTEETERFADRRQALAWLDAERLGLVSAVEWAREERFAGAAVRLALCLGEYLDWRRHFDDLITVSEAAREAAQLAGDRLNEAIAWSHLGNALQEVGRAEEAIDALTRARDLFQAAGDLHRETMAWGNLGNALHEAGRVEEAIDALTRARDLFQLSGHRHDEAMAWDNLGVALAEAGRTPEAINAHTRARDLFQAAGDLHGEGRAWHNLGTTLREAGRVAEAINAYGKDLEICQQFEDWYGAGQTLHGLALAHEDFDRPAEARAAYHLSADAFTRANAPAEAAASRTRATARPAPPNPHSQEH
ncbi:tetratricopeptide repeat protein [Streptomyces sp. NPDC004538]|uniref:tetratricopeptide repeat protein n=1 Tax=Streptomyces sp. NPDC004538 TaxID=3154279 RepID=UPI0033A43AB2